MTDIDPQEQATVDRLSALPKTKISEPDNPTPTLEAQCTGLDEGVPCPTMVKYHPPVLRKDEQLLCPPCAKRAAFVAGEAPPENVEYLRVGKHPAERVADVIADRWKKRYGKTVPKAAYDLYRDMNVAWGQKDGLKSVARMAELFEIFRDTHPKSWSKPYLLPSKDAFEEMKSIANTIIQTMTREEGEKQ